MNSVERHFELRGFLGGFASIRWQGCRRTATGSQRGSSRPSPGSCLCSAVLLLSSVTSVPWDTSLPDVDVPRVQSVLGGFLDPLADKIMVTSVALALGQQGVMPVPLVVSSRGVGSSPVRRNHVP